MIIDYKKTVKYNIGTRSDIIILDKTRVIKIPTVFKNQLTNQEYKKYKNKLINEYKILNQLYKHNFEFIPKPYDLIEISKNQIINTKINTNKKIMGFIYEYIKGINGDFIFDKIKRNELKTKLETQIKQCVEAGFNPYDISLINTIYNKETNILYLIDFEAWIHNNSKNL